MFLSNSAVKGALFLCVCVFICKVIGVLYRVPLTNILGAEGIGIYQLVFPLYSFLLVISSTSLPVGISRIISNKIKEKHFNYIEKFKRVIFCFFGVFGLVLTSLLLIFAFDISQIQGNTMATLGYLCIAPSVFLVCLLSVYRGILQGYKDMLPTGISQLIEQFIKMIAGILLPLAFLKYGISVSVAMALLGVTISELIALLYIMLHYKIKNKKIYNNINISNAEESSFELNSDKEGSCVKQIFHDLIKVILPIMLSGCITPLAVLIESFALINIMTDSYASVVMATEVYGVYSGVVMTLINAPIMLSSAISSALVPNLEQVYDSKDVRCQKHKSLNKEYCCSNAIYIGDDKIKKISGKNTEKIMYCIKLNLLISVISALCFVFFGYLIVDIFFPSLDSDFVVLSSKLLMVLSINVITLSFSYIFSSVLQGIGKFYKPLVCLFIMNVLRIALALICLQEYGIIAFAIASVFVYFLMFLELFKQVKNEI